MSKFGSLAALCVLVFVTSRDAADAACDEPTIKQNAQAKCMPIVGQMASSMQNQTEVFTKMVTSDPTSILQPKFQRQVQNLFALVPKFSLRSFFCFANEWRRNCPNAHPQGFYQLLGKAFCSSPGDDSSPNKMFPFYVNWKCGKTFSKAEAQSMWDGMMCHQKDENKVAGYAAQCIINMLANGTDATGGNKVLLAIMRLGKVRQQLDMQSIVSDNIKESLCGDPTKVMDCIGLRPIQDACSKEKACLFRSTMRNNLRCSRPDVACKNLQFKAVALPGVGAKPSTTTPASGAPHAMFCVPFLLAFAAAGLVI